MNIFNRLKSTLSYFNYTGTEKTYTETSVANWKRGLDITMNKDKGVTLPMKDSSIVYTCVSKISSNLPQAVIKFYQGEDEINQNDPVVQLFNHPNPTTNQFMFLEHSTMFFALYGEVFWYMVPSQGQISGTRNLPAELVVLDPRKMQTIFDNNKLVGWTFDSKIALTLKEVLHIKFPNPYSNIRGMSPIDGIQADMDSDYLSGKYSKQFFVNGAAPSTVFTTHEDDESTSAQKKEFLKEWNALHRGVSNSHKAAVLNAGSDVKTIGLTQEQMAYVDSRNFSALRIMSAFSVPPPIAGDWSKANYSNASIAKQIFWHETLNVYIKRYENMINSFIVEPYDNSIRAKFDYTEVNELKKDSKEVAEIVKTYAALGVPVNVLAESYNLPFGNLEGLDVGYQNISLIEVGSDGFSEEESPEEAPKSLDNTLNKSIRSQFLRDRKKFEVLFIKELRKYWFNQRSRILNKLLGKKEDENLTAGMILNKIDIWKQESINLENRFGKIYTNIADSAGKQALKNIGQSSGTFFISESILLDRMKVLHGINNSTFKTIEKLVQHEVAAGANVNKIGDKIKDLYSHISKTRAAKIARTEVGATINGQQIATYKDKGVKKKRWQGGLRDSHSDVTGTTVGINEAFHVGDSDLMFPGDPSGSAKETINCTCSCSPVIE